MKILCIGGGPAGLYFAILMKKLDPKHEIQVMERNGPSDTFGWGVVFSEETLGNLRDADPESYASIEASFARWNDITVFDRGQTFRSTGHGFCGLARKRLLNILQERARELGVLLTFNNELDLSKLALSDADLIVAADGLNSATRTRYQDSFQPSLDVRHSRYIWLGTEKKLEDFTFIFRENGHGIFQVHAYPFDDATSTFIVETDEETWKRAGLDKADEAQSIAYCEALFARDLDEKPLLGNSSKWIQFTTVRNAHWHHKNVVLLGDAAHTAHFSIGSGTKLAMEDSIALRDAFAKNGANVSLALEAYEAERRPVVERTQRAAQESLEWFENVRRYHGRFEPMQFAFSLLTRSRKITHDKLRQRDPQLIESVDRGFMRGAGLEVDTSKAPIPPMFAPFALRSMELVNRVGVSPMCMYSAKNGVPDDFHLVHLGSRAMGGAGLVITEMTDVSADGRITLGCAGMYNNEQMHAWKRIVDFVHGNTDAKIAMQLAHAGRKGSTVLPWEGYDVPLEEGGWEIIAPSAIPFHAFSRVPRAMTPDDIARVTSDFARAAERAEQAGFDMLELHMAHGYLLSSFLTPVSNQRSDEYGGSLENRMRFPLAVFDAVRKVFPSHKPMSVRISATDWVHGGFTAEDAVEFSRALAEHGVDIVNVSTGLTTPDWKPVFGRCWQTPFSDIVRNEAGIPTMTAGGITTPDEINSILAAGRADLCLLARPHLKDPYFTLHAAESLQHFDQAWPKQYALAKPVPRAPR